METGSFAFCFGLERDLRLGGRSRSCGLSAECLLHAGARGLHLAECGRDRSIRRGERLAADAGVQMPGMQHAKSIYQKGMDAGIGAEDWRATYKVVRGDYDA